jgi:hypothetical protein
MRNVTLTIEDQTYDLLSFDYSFDIDTDFRGRPSSVLNGGTIVVTMESTSNVELFRWMLGNKAKREGDFVTVVSGKIEVADYYEGMIFKQLVFEEAYIADGSMHFDANYGWGYMTETFRIVAMRLDINKFIQLDRRGHNRSSYSWHKYIQEPEQEVEMFVRPEDNSYTIRDMYWLDANGNEVRNLNVTEPVTLYVILGRYTDGSDIEISFEDKEDGDYRKFDYTGVVEDGVVVIRNFKLENA